MLLQFETNSRSRVPLKKKKKTNKFFARQDFPRTLRNPKVHERVFNSLPLVSIPSQRDPIHVLLSYFFKTNFSIIRPSTSRYFKLPHSFRFPCNPIITFTVLYWFQCVANRVNIANVPRAPKGRDLLISYSAKTVIGNLGSSKLIMSKI
jgi:hypothetical protein